MNSAMGAPSGGQRRHADLCPLVRNTALDSSCAGIL